MDYIIRESHKDARIIFVVFLPHYVWIDENGIVIAITGLREVNDLEISSALNQDYKQLTKKQDYKILY